MIVTLCGSARFEKAFKNWNERLTLMGHVVLSLSVYPSDKPEKNWYTPEQKEVLDRVHKLKINLADLVLIIDQPDTGLAAPYIGESTASEIAHARAMHKCVRFASSLTEDELRAWS